MTLQTLIAFIVFQIGNIKRKDMIFMMKKIIGLTLALVMVLVMVQVPVSAAETALFSFDFDSLEAGKILRNQSNIAGTAYTRSFSFNDDLADSTVTAGVSQSSTSIVTAETLSEGNNAVRFESVYEKYTSGSEEVVAQNYIGVDPEKIGVTVDTDEVIHFGIDFMTEDKNIVKSVAAKFDDWAWNVLDFESNGNIELVGTVVGTYDINTWYDIDLYFDVASKYWYLFINGDYVANAYKNTACSKIMTVRLTGSFGTETELHTIFWVDNMKLNKISNADLLAKLPDYYIGYNSQTVGATYGGAGVANETKANATQTAYFGNRANSSTLATVYERGTGDKAIRINIPTAETGNVYYHFGETVDLSNSEAFHFSFDFKAEDFNTAKSVVIRINDSNGDNWNFLRFNTDGTISLGSTTIGVYTLNTWYKVDCYLDVVNKKWYIIVNDDLLGSVSSGTVTSYIFTRFWFATGSNVSTTLHMDNLLMDRISSAELSAKLPATPTENTMKVVRNTADGINLMVNMAAVNNEFSGKLIAALYNGTELVEVQPFNASERRYIKFIETGDNAKIMWWNSDTSDITPKVVAVPVSFVTPAN